MKKILNLKFRKVILIWIKLIIMIKMMRKVCPIVSRDFENTFIQFLEDMTDFKIY